jgi:group I intron endonuclease
MLVYCAYNMVNGKVYVGQTTQTLRQRWNMHKSEARRNSQRYLCRAIRKYGEGSFEVFELGRVCTLRQLNNLEQQWVILLNACGHGGYNRTAGGDMGLNEEARKQMADTKRGRKLSEAHKEKIRCALRPKWSEEARSRWKGHKKSETTKQRISASKAGKPLSEEHKKALCKPHCLTPKLILHLEKLNSRRIKHDVHNS